MLLPMHFLAEPVQVVVVAVHWLLVAPVVNMVCSLPAQFLTCWTILQFGWRIFSRQAVDYRKKDAKERMRLYLSRSLFLTIEKLDFQFLVSCMYELCPALRC